MDIQRESLQNDNNSMEKRILIASLLVLTVLCLVLAVVPAAAQQVQIKQTPLVVQNGTATLVGHYTPTQKLRVVFALRPPQLEEEEELLRELQDKNSPQFHQYLSHEEWNARFAPSAEDEQAVVDWANSQSLTVTQRYPNRLLVDVEAPVATIEKALNITINHYQLGDKLFYSNDRDPSIPAHLANVVEAVLGANNLEVAHHPSAKGQETLEPDYVPGPVYAVGEHRQAYGDLKELEVAIAAGMSGARPSITNGAYDPSDIYSSEAYDYDALQNLGHCCNPLNNPDNSPPDASIAVVIWDDFSLDDIQGFHNQYPYLAYNIQKHSIDGTPLCCDPEATMDAEWTTATANSFGSPADTAKVNVYEGANNQLSTLEDAINLALTNGYARVLSMSWGAPEHDMDPNTMQAFHNIFNQMVGEGWTVVVSSGDAGATSGCGDYLSISWPASDPDVTAAGGTKLALNADGTYNSEVGWTGGPDGCASNDGGSTGGCSSYFPAPHYQSNTACGSYRSVPDIALNADWFYAPQNIYFQGSLKGNGGTSIVAPELAGFFAQENAYLLALGNICGASGTSACAPLGNANDILYTVGVLGYAPHYPFYDMTSGCNNNDITEEYHLPYYCASPGLDQVTGWGTANMLQLAWAFNTYFAFDSGAPDTTFSGPPTNQWYNTDQIVNWTVTDTSGNGRPPNGVAGFSAAWDLDPGDPSSEPTPGSGNSFYSGPKVPNDTNGELHLSKSGRQGWHTIHLRAWDNSGLGSSDLTYGPLGYDTIPPVTTFALSGNLQIILTATDNASGVAATYYEIDGSPFRPYVGPFMPPPGAHIIGFYSEDNAGNVEATVYVAFRTIATLTVSTRGNGSVTSTDGFINCPGTCNHTYPSNSPVTLNATPAQGWIFSGWSGACSGKGACNLTMTKNLSVSAKFTQLHYTLTVSTSGKGSVTSTDGFIHCPGTCTHSYPSNSPVTLNATPDLGWTFSGWSGACSGTGACNVTMTQDLSVRATFTRLQYYTLTVSTSGNGTVTSTDGFINCPGTCNHTYPSNSKVILDATAADGWTFSGWSGACSGKDRCKVTMTQDLSVSATFTQLDYTLRVHIYGKGTVTSTDGIVNCSGPGECSYLYLSNSQVTLNATPAQGWTFKRWGAACSGEGACVVNMTKDLSVSATFKRK